MQTAQPTHPQPPYCDENRMRLLAEYRKRIAELEAALRNWMDNYVRHAGGPTIAVPVYQIEALLQDGAASGGIVHQTPLPASKALD